MSKSNVASNVPGLKTPLNSDKLNKKQPFTMTPDIHTKTYAERNLMANNQANTSGFGPIIFNFQNDMQNKLGITLKINPTNNNNQNNNKNKDRYMQIQPGQ